MTTPTAKKTQASLCSGYGGLDQSVDGDLCWYAENQDDASRVMKREHPEAPNLGDLTEADWRKVEPVDILTMGLPCQPVANPGRGLVAADARWLWPHAHQALRILQPMEVFLENVEGLVSATWVRGRGVRGEVFRTMLTDLRDLGYAVRWTVMGACAVGACHHRHRVFLHARLVDGVTPVAERLGSGRICGAPRSGDRVLLPTPTARDGDVEKGRGEGSAGYWARRTQVRNNGLPLGAVVQLLPTPTARDGMGGPGTSPNRSGGMNLRTAVLQDWGRYAEAVALQEEHTRPAPLPTEANTRGGRRLAAAFPEWMMGLPEGFLTSEMGRPEAIQRAGNGVMPQQARAAYQMLTS